MSNKIEISASQRGLFSSRFKLTPENMGLMRNFPGYCKWSGREFLFRPSGDCLDFITANFRIVCSDESVQDFINKHNQAKLIAAENRANKEADYFDDSGYEYKRPPMDHQKQAFALSRDRDLFAYFMEQGTGKTKVTIDNAAWLYEKGEIDCLLIVAWPNGVHRQWVDGDDSEVHKDLPERIPRQCTYWDAERNTKAKAAEIYSTLNFNGLAVMSFNAEAFTSPRARKCIEEFLTKRKCFFALDQSACIKNWNGKRTKFLINMSKLAKHKRILDGDPATEGAQELFAQMYFLDPLIIGIDTWTNFKATYCRIGRFNNVEGYINLPELMSKIDAYVFRAREEDCLDIPKRRYRRWPFDLNPKERRIFDELKKKDFSQFKEESDEDGIIETNLAIVKNTRLQQIASGWFPDSESGDLKEIGSSSRQKAFRDLCLHIDSDKAIIFARFKPDILAIEKLLGDSCVSYHGGKNSDEKANAKRRFMNDDSVQFIVGQQSTLSIGHTLTKAKHVIFYTNNPSLRFRTEAEKRAHRNGLQDTLKEGERLMIWDLIANNTTDHATMTSLREKRDLATVIMNDPVSFFLMED